MFQISEKIGSFATWTYWKWQMMTKQISRGIQKNFTSSSAKVKLQPQLQTYSLIPALGTQSSVLHLTSLN